MRIIKSVFGSLRLVQFPTRSYGLQLHSMPLTSCTPPTTQLHSMPLSPPANQNNPKTIELTVKNLEFTPKILRCVAKSHRDAQLTNLELSLILTNTLLRFKVVG